MADVLSGFGGVLGVMNLGLADPVGLAVNIILSTIVGGIVILIVVGILAKKFSEEINPLHAFLLALAISLINLFGIVGLLAGIIGALPFGALIVLLLPVLVWIVLVKLFFKGLGMLHAAIVGVIGYLLSIYLIPMLVSMVAGFIPV